MNVKKMRNKLTETLGCLLLVGVASGASYGIVAGLDKGVGYFVEKTDSHHEDVAEFCGQYGRLLDAPKHEVKTRSDAYVREHNTSWNPDASIWSWTFYRQLEHCREHGYD